MLRTVQSDWFQWGALLGNEEDDIHSSDDLLDSPCHKMSSLAVMRGFAERAKINRGAEYLNEIGNMCQQTEELHAKRIDVALGSERASKLRCR